MLLAFLDGNGDCCIIDEHPKDGRVIFALPRTTDTHRMRVVGHLTFKST
jgi:hypothetical protein